MRRPRVYAVALVMLLPFGIGAFLWQHPALIIAAQLFDQAVQTLSSRYVDSLPMDSLYLRAARGMVKEFHDPYTVVFTPAEAGAFQSFMTGNVTGIGISMASNTGAFHIAYVFPGTPASEGGLRVGDKILRVDTLPVTSQMSMQDVSSHIMGPAGTPVQLTLVRYEATATHPDTVRVTLHRAPVHRSVVPYTLMLDHHVGYIPLTQFAEGAASEVHDAIQALTDSGATRFVLDLRGNPGGLTNEAVALCGLFLTPGDAVVKMRSRAGEQTFETQPVPPLTDKPLAVLVNANTASASEITSGALQDHDRAVVIGQPTYGKGVGQEIAQLPDGYAMKFTTMRWYTPLGRSIQRPHKLLPTGEYAETPPDSFETQAERAKRPTLKSANGRLIYGGGGVVPEVLVHDVSDIAQQVALDSALKANAWPMQSILSSYALKVAPTVTKPIKVTPAIRTKFLADLRANGIVLTPAVIKAHGALIDRVLAERIAYASGGSAAAKKVSIEKDASLMKAIAILSESSTQADVFTRAARMQ